MSVACEAPALKAVPIKSQRQGVLDIAASVDQQWSLRLNETFRQRVPRQAFMLLEHSGNGILWLLFAPALWLLAHMSTEGRLAAANFFVGLWVDIGLVGALKALTKRPRPEYNISGDFTLVVAVDKYSFPSGHAARVSYVAAFALLILAKESLLLSILVSGWAMITALSRASMGRHYLGDVLAGLLLGIVTTAITTKGTFQPTVGWIPVEPMEELHERLCSRIRG